IPSQHSSSETSSSRSIPRGPRSVLPNTSALVKPPLSLLSLLIMSAVSPAAAQDSRLVLVTRDSVPLRRLPASTAPIARYAHATLQLAVIGVSADSTWYRVGIGEDKGYQLRHGDHYWVTRTDVSEPRPLAGDASVDLTA